MLNPTMYEKQQQYCSKERFQMQNKISKMDITNENN